MKKTTRLVSIAAAAVMALGSLAQAQDKPAQEGDHTGRITLGVVQEDADTLSSKFEEYREVPNGVVVPAFRLQGDTGTFRYTVSGQNVRQRDQRFGLALDHRAFSLEGDYNQIPHGFGNAGRTLLQQTGPGRWELSDTLQQRYQDAIIAVPRAAVTYAFLSNLVAPSLATANVVDLRLERERGNLALSLAPAPDLSVRLSYFRERRVGNRAASGTAFGFSNVVELPEALHYLTQDLGADAEYEGSWGVVRAGLHYNWFENRIETFSWDNPFRAVDSTDASAYQSPGSASVNGPSRALMALPPDNEAWRGTVGATVKLPSKTRLTANVARGSWTQNQSPFIPYSTNTSITVPLRATDPATLPAPRLDGKIDVTSLSAAVTTRPAPGLTLQARFRSYDLDNGTPRLTFPGYVRFDAVWEDIPRISVPYSFQNRRFDATVGYDFGKLSLEGGYKRVGSDRTFRETETTTESGFTLAADLRPTGWALLRAGYERAERDFEGYEAERSEEASFVIHGTPVNLLALPGNVRFDQARKDVDRISAQAQLSPGGNTTLALAYLRTKDEYKDTPFGLLSAQYDTFTAEVDYTPSERWSVYGFYTRETVADFQRGRQSGATVSTNPLDDWTSTVDDKIDSFGGGGRVVLVPEKWSLNASGRYQKVDGNNDLFAPEGGAPANARRTVGGVADLPLYDDTKILTLSAEVTYHLSKAWECAVGGWFEDYEVEDSNTAGLLNYVPASFFLAASDGSYQGKVAYLRMSYRW